jgi:hypothetical protein
MLSNGEGARASCSIARLYKSQNAAEIFLAAFGLHKFSTETHQRK